MTALQIPRSRSLPALPSKLRDVMVQAVSDTSFTHTDIARRAGLDRSTVSNVLSGRRSGTVDTWSLILEASDVELVAVLS